MNKCIFLLFQGGWEKEHSKCLINKMRLPYIQDTSDYFRKKIPYNQTPEEAQ